MSIKSGDVVEGVVTKITKYGAFFKLPDNNTGLCHISEVSNEFVKDVNDYLKEEQVVKVKVLNVKDDGKVELSIKALKQKAPNNPRSFKKEKPNVDFENMLSDFLKNSEDNLKVLKERDQKF
ncbi:MAG TPA: S1 RNA-binding domain-containing protein [Eubacteriaceae bacterium]|nr:S1 RNA-binding domain-containing protein [Eubacteriaceae bacterium]